MRAGGQSEATHAVRRAKLGAEVPMTRSDRAVDLVIAAALAIDLYLVGRTAIDPGWWFQWLHGRADPTPGEVAFLYRCAAHWTAFVVVQALALARWRSWPGLLLILAGVRFSDVLTDWTYLASAGVASGTALAGLLSPGFLNAGMGAYLVAAWRARARTEAGHRGQLAR